MQVIKDDQSREPFIRGIFAYKLIQRGMSFEDAYQIAKDAKNRLGKTQEIRSSELLHLADRLVIERFGEERLQRLKPRLQPQAARVVVQRTNSASPFSKGLMTQSLTASGLPPEEAYRLAYEVESELHQSGQTTIDHEDLFKLVTRKITEHYGKQTSSLYGLASRINQLDRPVVLLIGGASGTGKSTLATALASRLGINQVIGTDSIREIMRMAFSQDLLPTLHHSSTDVGSKLELSGAREFQRMIAGFMLQSQQVNVGVQAVISRSIEERTSIILEGVHLIPAIEQAMRMKEARAYLVPAVVTLINEKAHRNRFLQRGQVTQRPSEKYLRRFENIREIHDYFLSFGNREDLDLINNENFDLAINELTQTIISSLHEQVQHYKKPRKP